MPERLKPLSLEEAKEKARDLLTKKFEELTDEDKNEGKILITELRTLGNDLRKNMGQDLTKFPEKNREILDLFELARNLEQHISPAQPKVYRNEFELVVAEAVAPPYGDGDLPIVIRSVVAGILKTYAGDALIVRNAGLRIGATVNQADSRVASPFLSTVVHAEYDNIKRVNKRIRASQVRIGETNQQLEKTAKDQGLTIGENMAGYFVGEYTRSHSHLLPSVSVPSSDSNQGNRDVSIKIDPQSPKEISGEVRQHFTSIAHFLLQGGETGKIFQVGKIR